MNFPLNLDDHNVFVIAEVGNNHNGSMDTAKKLVDLAAKAKADVIKFQLFRPELMMVQNTPKAEYQSKATDKRESQFERLIRVGLKVEDQKILADYCNEQNVMFTSSPFDIQSVSDLLDLDVPFIKIPSGEIVNIPYLRSIGETGKPVIMSTGCANLGEIEKAINTLVISGTKETDIALLHCISVYPLEIELANLSAIETLKQVFGLPVGFSDHSNSIELAIAAVSIGARIIEKHITLDRNMEGGDHKASIEPLEFEKMVNVIKKIPAALGDGVKRCIPEEMDVLEVARKSIVTKRAVKAGETMDLDDIACKRPGTGLLPEFIPLITGRTVKYDLDKDHLIQWNDFV